MFKLGTKKTMLIAGLAALASIAVMVLPVGATGTNALVLHGSTTLGPIMVDAVNDFNGRSGANSTINNNAIAQDGSSNGIGDLLQSLEGVTVTSGNGGCDVAMASRPLKTTEHTGNSTATPPVPALTETPVARDGLEIIVNNNVPSTGLKAITSLTVLQIKGIFEGVYTNWDNAAVTVGSKGMLGADGTYYDKNMVFPKLGDGSGTGPTIDLQSRIIASGTRAFIGSSDPLPYSGTQATATITTTAGAVTGFTFANNGTGYDAIPTITINGGGSGFTGVAQYDGTGKITSVIITAGGTGYINGQTVSFAPNNVLGCNFAKGANHTDSGASSGFELEEVISGTNDLGNGTNGKTRTDSNVDIQNEVNNATTAMISYVGMGFGADANHTNIREIPIVNYNDGSPYSATPVNVYTYKYPLSRYLYLDYPTTPVNQYVAGLVTWMTTLDGVAQRKHVTNEGFLMLVPDVDVLNSGVIDISQVQEIGNYYGQTKPADIRADVLRDGIVDISDIQEVGNWYGTVIANYPHP